ncbi:MAG: DUF4870 family protein [Burkholderiales bacterium]
METLPETNTPAPALVAITHAVYALHALSILIGISSAAFIVTAFVFGIPSILAVVINYMNQKEARGTFIESHFRWQIRSFWFALVWLSVAFVLALTIIGIPLAAVLAIGTGLWLIYRIARGWLALRDRKPLA